LHDNGNNIDICSVIVLIYCRPQHTTVQLKVHKGNRVMPLSLAILAPGD